jgi:hypothetical protein
MLLRLVGLSIGVGHIDGVSVAILMLREGRGDEAETVSALVFVMTFVESSMMLADEVRANDLRPGRG